MNTGFRFASTHFAPTAEDLAAEDPDLAPSGEHPYNGEDGFDPGLATVTLARFVAEALAREGYRLKPVVVEDWGSLIEIDHPGKFLLAAACKHVEELGGGVTSWFVDTIPDTPVIRKWFRKIDVSADVQRLNQALGRILSGSDRVTDVKPGWT